VTDVLDAVGQCGSALCGLPWKALSLQPRHA